VNQLFSCEIRKPIEKREREKSFIVFDYTCEIEIFLRRYWELPWTFFIFFRFTKNQWWLSFYKPEFINLKQKTHQSKIKERMREKYSLFNTKQSSRDLNFILFISCLVILYKYAYIIHIDRFLYSLRWHFTFWVWSSFKAQSKKKELHYSESFNCIYVRAHIMRIT
jgi:hypothetical protein